MHFTVGFNKDWYIWENANNMQLKNALNAKNIYFFLWMAGRL